MGNLLYLKVIEEEINKYTSCHQNGKAKRISFGNGRYGTPVWSPRGDMIAFTKMYKGNFHIGVMRKDGSQERLLTKAFIDEGPTWAPNGRILCFSEKLLELMVLHLYIQ